MPNEGSYEAAVRRSDEIQADLAEHAGKYNMLTGDRPTGRLHLGHYFGTIVERVRLQNLGVHTNIIIADYQVITDRDTTEHIADNVYNMVIDYLACGIDPEKTMIFTHSAVPALNQLMLPFLSLVTESELHRNPTVKAEQEASGHALTGLLLTYPVHQACDILFCKGNVVPVGRDQLPHIEITSKIARRFNESYGKVWVLGKDVSKLSTWAVPKLRRQIGTVFQDFRLLPSKTVYENVALAMQVIGKPRHAIETSVPDALELVGLSGKESRLPHELSGGEEQRVAIARAMVNRPELLLADEPTGNLDPETSLGIMRLLDRINRTGTTVVMATHDADIVNQMRKRVIELEAGDVVRDQTRGVYGAGR